MLDLTQLASIVDEFCEPATLIRYATPDMWLPNGVHDPDAWHMGEVRSSILATIQPPTAAAANEMQMHNIVLAPEGERAEGLVIVWTRAVLRAEDASGVGADEIEIRGKRYKVIAIMTRPEGAFTRALARLVTDAGDRAV